MMIDSSSGLERYCGSVSMILLDGMSSAAQQDTGRNVLCFIILIGLVNRNPSAKPTDTLKRLCVADGDTVACSDKLGKVGVEAGTWKLAHSEAALVVGHAGYSDNTGDGICVVFVDSVEITVPEHDDSVRVFLLEFGVLTQVWVKLNFHRITSFGGC